MAVNWLFDRRQWRVEKQVQGAGEGLYRHEGSPGQIWCHVSDRRASFGLKHNRLPLVIEQLGVLPLFNFIWLCLVFTNTTTDL